MNVRKDEDKESGRRQRASRWPFPKCGSGNTRVDWRRPDIYRMLVLAAVALAAGAWFRRYDRVCRDCGWRSEV